MDHCKVLTMNWENQAHKGHFLFVAQKPASAQLASGTNLKGIKQLRMYKQTE